MIEINVGPYLVTCTVIVCITAYKITELIIDYKIVRGNKK